MERLDIIIAISVGVIFLVNIIELITEHIFLKRVMLEREEKENKRC